MKLGITGSRAIPNDGYVASVLDTIYGLDYYDEYVSGGANGVDKLVSEMIFHNVPDSKHVIILPYNKAFVWKWWEHWLDSGRIEVIDTGMSYRERNQAIVDRVDELIYFALHPEDSPMSIRSGTWQTVRMARAKKIPVSGFSFYNR